ncbi:hypothetical protein AAFF_G00071220 [Aldrovandia affinis]|uniref:Ig-like domain-containing protein n=1 Tax=Aldrovandia affinis TaxID=143900 RepID=A0AAD7RYX7_9TELE|nr:hypothetical protein AAFF_G00071220 [Aldrovandia affinis]
MQGDSTSQNLQFQICLKMTCILSLIVLCLGSIICDDFYVERGKTANMHCNIAHATTDEWTYNSQSIVKENRKTGRQIKGPAPMASRAKIVRNSLEISRLESADSGPYACKSETDKIEHKLYVISVSASPAGPFIQGTKVKLQCQISGDPKLKPVWLRPNGKPATTSDTGSLALTTADTGEWACQVNSHKIKLQITVLGLLPSPKLSVKKGDSVLLPCTPSLSLSSSGLQLQEGGWKRLKPNPAPLLSLGKTLIWNSVEVQKKSLEFPQEKLDGNFSVILKNVQQSGLYECSLKFKEKGNVTAQVVLEVNSQPVESVDTVGTGPDTDVIQSDSEKVFLGLSLWIWLGVGVGSLVLIVLIAVIVSINQRNKRMKKRARKLRLMRQTLTARDYCQCNRTAGRPNGRPRAASAIKERQR